MKDIASTFTYEEMIQSDRLCEALEAYGAKKQGDYTIDDYYALPDDVRVELIDGYFFEMNAPGSQHQAALLELAYQFKAFLKAQKHATCRVFIAPFDVKIDNSNRTMVQPDLMVICDRSGLDMKRYNGAPDFIIEVLSPSTRKKDTTLKLQKYRETGVREYWTVDPKGERVIVYDLEHGSAPRIYGFDAEIPVGIWGGALRIRFADVAAELRWIEA